MKITTPTEALTTGWERAAAFQVWKRKWQDEFYKDTPVMGLETRQEARARDRAWAKTQRKEKRSSPALRVIKLSLPSLSDARNRGSLSSKAVNVRQAMRGIG